MMTRQLVANVELMHEADSGVNSVLLASAEVRLGFYAWNCPGIERNTLGTWTCTDTQQADLVEY